MAASEGRFPAKSSFQNDMGTNTGSNSSSTLSWLDNFEQFTSVNHNHLLAKCALELNRYWQAGNPFAVKTPVPTDTILANHAVLSFTIGI